jgi:imidazole glycerol phosphate synthase glutamine amidotransferase subunit
MSREVLMIRTGVANTASVVAAFERLGTSVRLSESAADVRTASHVVLPGVGAFGPAMRKLRDRSLVEPLVERITGGRPTLAICLGLQLLCKSSTEMPGEDGLGIVPREVTGFDSGLRVPQIGWNAVRVPTGSRYLTNGYAYFANSYRLAAAPEDWLASSADYGGPFVAAFERGRVLACQFHPELSGEWGLSVLRRWLHDGMEDAC